MTASAPPAWGGSACHAGPCGADLRHVYVPGERAVNAKGPRRAREAVARGGGPLLPVGKLAAQPRHRLPVQLAHARFRDLQHRGDLLEVELLLVVETEQQLLARRELFDRRHQRSAEARVLAALERILALVGQVALEERVLVVAREVLEVQQ